MFQGDSSFLSFEELHDLFVSRSLPIRPGLGGRSGGLSAEDGGSAPRDRPQQTPPRPTPARRARAHSDFGYPCLTLRTKGMPCGHAVEFLVLRLPEHCAVHAHSRE